MNADVLTLLLCPLFAIAAMGCGVLMAWTVVREQLAELERRVRALEDRQT